MPKPKRITVVSLEKKQEDINEPEGLVVTQEPLDEPIQIPNEEQLNKPKPKRKPRSKKQDEPTQQPEINIITTLDETVAEVVIPEITTSQSKPKVAEKVKCPDCGKMVSDKTFKYTHIHNCKSKKEAMKEQHVEDTEVKEQDESKQVDVEEEYVLGSERFQPVEITLPLPKPLKVETQREIRNRLRTERLKALFANAV
jgi:hypothetical protein